MKMHAILWSVAVLGVGLLLAACTSAPTSPLPTSTPGSIPASSSASQQAALPGVSDQGKPAVTAAVWESQHNAGGGVTVDAKPVSLGAGAPVAFDIALNTHSVDLGDDMVQISILRDDAGVEYRPTAWDGDSPGGHHRSGTLKFGALTGKPRSIQLIVKGLAQVTERVFKWELP